MNNGAPSAGRAAYLARLRREKRSVRVWQVALVAFSLVGAEHAHRTRRRLSAEQSLADGAHVRRALRRR